MLQDCVLKCVVTHFMSWIFLIIRINFAKTADKQKT